MEWLALVLVVVVFYFIFSSKKAKSSPKKAGTKSQGSKQGATAFDNPIPKGYQIFASNLPVAGMQHRKNEAIQFAQSTNQALEMEREPNNPHDPNAIRLNGVSNDGKYFIGYLPKELSEQIVATGLYDLLKVRLTRIYSGTDDYLEFHYQILGPKTEKKRFDEFLKSQPAEPSQKEYLKFFSLPTPKGMTFGQAEQAINEHKKNSSKAEQDEWLGYTTILEEFDDADFRETYDLKRVPKTFLLDIIKQMKEEGKTYSYLGNHIDEIVDKIIKVKPELERTT